MKSIYRAFAAFAGLVVSSTVAMADPRPFTFSNDTYAVGYADCGPSIDGPCVKKTVDKPWLASDPDLDMFGPGTPTFYRDGRGNTIMAVNTWKFSGGEANPKNHGQQVMHLFEVHIGANGRPLAKFVRMVE